MRPKGQPRSSRGQLLAEIADGQHGVVALRQLEGIGFSQRAVAREAAAGRLHRLHRGVYAVGHTAVPRHGHCLAAVLAAGPGALLSHRSAGWLWGATEVPPSSARGDHVGLAVLRPRALRGAVDRVERLGLFDLAPVEALLARTTGHPGHGRLRRALALYQDDPTFVRAPLERRFLEFVRRFGLPRPAVNVWIEGYELDAYWERERFAVELDGFEFHRTRAAFESDRRRQEDLKVAGIEMLRVTDRRLSTEPEILAERIATLLARRRTGRG